MTNPRKCTRGAVLEITIMHLGSVLIYSMFNTVCFFQDSWGQMAIGYLYFYRLSLVCKTQKSYDSKKKSTQSWHFGTNTEFHLLAHRWIIMIMHIFTAPEWTQGVRSVRSADHGHRSHGENPRRKWWSRKQSTVARQCRHLTLILSFPHLRLWWLHPHRHAWNLVSNPATFRRIHSRFSELQ